MKKVRLIIRVFIVLFCIIILSTVKAEAANFSSPGLASNYPIAIAARNGVVWVTNAGIARYWNGSSWVSISIGFSLNNYTAVESIVDGDGRLWVSLNADNYHDDKTGYVDMTTNTWTLVEDNLGNYNYFIKQTNNGDIWAAKGSRVYKFNGSGFTQITSRYNDSEGYEANIGQFTVDFDGVLWRGGSITGGDYYPAIFYWNGSSWICNTSWSGSGRIWSLAVSGDGTIVARGTDSGTYVGWAEKKLNGSWTTYTGSCPFSSYLPLKTALDGTVWGVSKVNTRCLVYYENSSWHTTVGASSSIQDFDIDDNGIIWAVLSNGSVAAYLEGTWFTDTTQADSLLIQAAKKAADEAKLAASQASAYSQQAKSSADIASTRAQTTVNQTIDAGTSAASWAHQSYDKANAAASDTTYIRNTQFPNLETKINNLQTSITNIQNSDTVPPLVDVQTVSGARATSGSSIQAIVTVTDNRPGPYTYSINGGSYSTLPADGRVTLPVTIAGNNTITVYVKDVAGNIGSKTIVIRKL